MAWQIKTWNDNTPSLSCPGQITLRNLSITNHKPDLHSTNSHIKFGENPLRFTQVIILRRKYVCVALRLLCQNWRNLLKNNPKADLYIISAHGKLRENSFIFSDVISGNRKKKKKKKKKKKTDMSRAGNSVKNWRNFPIRSPKLDYNINVRNVWWKSINIYSIYHSKT